MTKVLVRVMLVLMILAVGFVNAGERLEKNGSVLAENKRITVAIYVGPGTWEPSVSGLEEVFNELGIKWKEIDAVVINAGLSEFAAIAFPGGWAPKYNEEISDLGMQNIRTFVEKGGIFMGFCAGAYFVAKTVLWEGIAYPYALGIFNGTAIGPLPDIAPWPEHKITNVLTADGELEMDYSGGPLFYPAPGETIAVLGTWSEFWGSPAIVLVYYGHGKVFLSGAHPEVYGPAAKEWLKNVLSELLSLRIKNKGVSHP